MIYIYHSNQAKRIVTISFHNIKDEPLEIPIKSIKDLKVFDTYKKNITLVDDRYEYDPTNYELAKTGAFYFIITEVKKDVIEMYHIEVSHTILTLYDILDHTEKHVYLYESDATSYEKFLDLYNKLKSLENLSASRIMHTSISALTLIMQNN